MSWLSKATGIHWGNIGAPVGAVLGSIIPGVGTALGSALGGAIGGMSGHKNNMAGNIINGVTGIASAVPSIAGAAQGLLGGSAPSAGSFLGGAGGSAAVKGASLAAGAAAPKPGTPGASGGGATGLSSIGNIFANPDGSVDWGKLADMGLTGVDAYNAAMNAQKQGSLLNTGVSNYNNNWTQGKNILMKAHPVDLSADFAGSDNPFARPSAGAVPGASAPMPGAGTVVGNVGTPTAPLTLPVKGSAPVGVKPKTTAVV